MYIKRIETDRDGQSGPRWRTNKQTGQQACSVRDGRTDRQANDQNKTGRPIKRQSDPQTDQKTHLQTGGQTDRFTDR